MTIGKTCGHCTAEFDHVFTETGQSHVVAIGSYYLLNVRICCLHFLCDSSRVECVIYFLSSYIESDMGFADGDTCSHTR